jgi:hypothetical protein
MNRNLALARVRARLGRANDLSILTDGIVTPGDVRGMLDQLKADYDVVNTTAAQRPDWQVHYKEFVAYYERTRPEIGWFSTGHGTITQIRDRRRQLEAWKEKLAREGVKVASPPRREAPSTLGDLSGLLWAGAALAGLILAGKALRS